MISAFANLWKAAELKHLTTPLESNTRILRHDNLFPRIPLWTTKIHYLIGNIFYYSIFHLELGVDFDRGFSSGFSRPDIFRAFSFFGHAHEVSKSITKSVFSLEKHKTKNPPPNPSQNPSLWAEKSITKSVTATAKIHRTSAQRRRAAYLHVPTCKVYIQ